MSDIRRCLHIHDLFAKMLREHLDYEFEDYVTEDDYYQPVVEDFDSNLEYELQKWSKDNGFEFVSCEGNGYDSYRIAVLANGPDIAACRTSHCVTEHLSPLVTRPVAMIRMQVCDRNLSAVRTVVPASASR